MIVFLIAFIFSSVSTILIVRTQKFHRRFTSDSQIDGPQKFHTHSVPRIGGIGVALGVSIAIFSFTRGAPYQSFGYALLFCAAPVFVIGLAEDLSKRIGVKTRLLFTAIGALLATIMLEAQILRLDITGIDYLLTFPTLSILFTVFAITGVSNAYNIIDGFNGLSSMVAIITLVALGFVSIVLGDGLLANLSFTMASAVLGFFIWNYPRGLIFLGDSGAYFIGFWVAILSILVVARHSEVSPWFALLINAYPALETLFTIYRRKIYQGKNPGQPDGIHLHSLIFRRILYSKVIKDKNDWFSANAKTSPYLWMLATLSIVPATIFWQDTTILIAFLMLFTLTYVWLYKKIISFRTPNWMRIG
jgi:UDP-N-acetylmuramyl pentapeptide phosphotransferase/UDP-N-acetylglucosamine-1-phosphate transferase